MDRFRQETLEESKAHERWLEAQEAATKHFENSLLSEHGSLLDYAEVSANEFVSAHLTVDHLHQQVIKGILSEHKSLPLASYALKKLEAGEAHFPKEVILSVAIDALALIYRATGSPKIQSLFNLWAGFYIMRYSRQVSESNLEWEEA